MAEASDQPAPTPPQVTTELPTNPETFECGNPLVDHLCRELNITHDEVARAFETKQALADAGLTISASQIDSAAFFGKLWLPEADQVPKISSIDILAPFLPDEIRNIGIKAKLFDQQFQAALGADPDLKERIKSRAKDTVLGLLGKGVGIGFEAHCETDLGIIRYNHWHYLLAIHRLLNNCYQFKDSNPFANATSLYDINLEAVKAPNASETAHLAFMWVTNEDSFDVHQDNFTQRVESELSTFRLKYGKHYPAVFATDFDEPVALTQFALNHFWEAPKGVVINDHRYFDFAMFFPSGHVIKPVRDSMTEGRIGDFPMEALHERAQALSAAFATGLFMDQIEWMKHYGIDHYTFHAGPLGGNLTDGQMATLKTNLRALAHFCSLDTIKAKISLETQSLTQTQYEELFNDPELKPYWGKQLGITVDLVHVAAENATLAGHPPLNYWLEKIEAEDSVVGEIHVSASAPHEWSKMASQRSIKDNHLGVSQTSEKIVAPGLVEIVPAIVRHNLQAKAEGKPGIIIAQEATMQQADLETIAALIPPEFIKSPVPSPQTDLDHKDA